MTAGGARWWRCEAAYFTAALACLAFVAACSATGSSASSSGSSTASPPGTTAGAAAASTSQCSAQSASYLQAWAHNPTELPSAYTPLAKKPQPGGTVIYIVGPVPSDQETAISGAAAAAAVGWAEKTLVTNGSVEDVNAKFEQAIAEKPTMITIGGYSPSEIEQPLADAKAAGIVVSLTAIADQPTGYPGFAAISDGSGTANQIGVLEAYQFMKNSNCRGNVAVFSLSSYPFLQIISNAFTSTVKAHCSECRVSNNLLQLSALGTPALTSSIVSALQSSPTTRYAFTMIGDMATGLTAALSQAGISGEQIFGFLPNAEAIGALRNGTNAWWVYQDPDVLGWTAFDAGLRALTSGRVSTSTDTYPLAVLTPSNVPTGSSIPAIPASYRAEFEALWHV